MICFYLYEAYIICDGLSSEPSIFTYMLAYMDTGIVSALSDNKCHLCKRLHGDLPNNNFAFITTILVEKSSSYLSISKQHNIFL